MTNNQVTDIVASLKGMAPWGVNLGVGSFLTMEFGKPKTKPSEGTAHGEWHLWLYMCMWRIETQDKVLVGSEDDREAIRTTLERTTFDSIHEIKVALPSLDLSIEFNSGIKVLTFSCSIKGDEQWMLFTPDGKVLTVYGGGQMHYASSSEPRHMIEK